MDPRMHSIEWQWLRLPLGPALRSAGKERGRIISNFIRKVKIFWVSVGAVQRTARQCRVGWREEDQEDKEDKEDALPQAGLDRITGNGMHIIFWQRSA